MAYLAPVLYFGLGNVFDGHLKAVAVSDAGVDDGHYQAARGDGASRAKVRPPIWLI